MPLPTPATFCRSCDKRLQTFTSSGLGLALVILMPWFESAHVFELVQIAVERGYRKAALRSRRRQIRAGKMDIVVSMPR